MLDEPSLGLAPAIIDQVYALLAAIRAEGVTILLVEQNAERAFALADRAYVMSGGAVVLARSAGELKARSRVRRRLFRGRHGGGGAVIERLVQTLADVVSVGGLYALTALGIGLIFGVMRLINFAHGELIMITGYALLALFGAAAGRRDRRPPSSPRSCWR